jgi:ribonuclease J
MNNQPSDSSRQSSKTRVYRHTSGPIYNSTAEKSTSEPVVKRKVFIQQKPQFKKFPPKPTEGQQPNGPARPNNKPKFNNRQKFSHNKDFAVTADVDKNSERTAPIAAGTKVRPRRKPTRPQQHPDAFAPIPALEKGAVRVIPICGVEWIGTNMTAVEYNDEIVVIDAGFGFKNPDLPGINYTIPNTKYLEENKHKIKALVITHGHMDHVGAIPYVIEKIGNPPIYTMEFGAIFIQKRMEEFPQLPKLNIVIVDRESTYITLSENFKVRFFGLTHSIPDSSGVIIKTPMGSIVSTGDVRVENTNGIPAPDEVEQYSFFKQEEEVLLLTMDSTGAKDPGWANSEMAVRENLDKIIRDVPGRLFIAAFSSQVERLMSFLDSAKKYNKYVVIDGRSMKSNLGIAEFLNLTNFDHVVPMEDVDKYPPDKLMIILTGGQGEEYSALDRLGKGEHRFLKIHATDTIVLSASVVPGNDFQVDKLKDSLYRTGARIVSYIDNVVHASGHGKREELKWLHEQIPHKYFMPVHGRHWFLKMHEQIALECGTPKENIFIPENGSIFDFSPSGTVVRQPMKAIDSPCWIVDGSYMGPLQDVVMEDRKVLGSEGMFVVSAVLDLRRKTLIKSPDIASRGHTYLRESKELLNRVRTLVKRTCEQRMQGVNPQTIDIDQLKKEINDRVTKYIMQKTLKAPIVMTIITTI